MLQYTENTLLKDLVLSGRGRRVMEKYVPAFPRYPNTAVCMQCTMKELAAQHHMGITENLLEQILYEMNTGGCRKTQISLDEIEQKGYGADPSVMDGDFRKIVLSADSCRHTFHRSELSLDGTWILSENENESAAGHRQGTIAAVVPGSIHTALTQAGKIPDTTVGRNQETGRKASYRDWWLKREFSRPDMEHPVLYFKGVCNRCEIWLNGSLLGSHEGMFSGFSFDLCGKLQQENTLAVHLFAIPFIQEQPADSSVQLNEGSNDSWKYTVVSNNVYGWHYSKMPSIGIWQSVTIFDSPPVRIEEPFIATASLENACMKLSAVIRSETGSTGGILSGVISPENFGGRSYSFSVPVKDTARETVIRLSFEIPDAHLWWPNDLGRPDLYRLQLCFLQENKPADSCELVFGIRTVTMAPLPDGPAPEYYNWTFVVNGKPAFIKGSGWCTMDALMDFRRERYERFLSLCRDQHIQMLRGWGSGMPETDDFYDLCDHYGIMVLQEWPTAWNSHETQPFDLLEETVRQNTIRLRSRASLVMWGGGNESPCPYGKAIDMMGRLAAELDGTRPFHRGEPWGGSEHDYSCWWGYRDLNYNAGKTAVFHGEFGLACLPDYDSVQKYLPEEEKGLWPVKRGGGFEYHTPVFGCRDDLNRLMQYAGYFTDLSDTSLQEFVMASQLATATGVRHPLERSRTRWPYSTGALYYKINDNFPAASWSSIDWYGVPKMGHYVFQDAFAPLHAAILFDTLDFLGTPVRLPVWLLDDADALCGREWSVQVRVYDEKLQLVRSESYSGSGSIQQNRLLGTLALTRTETDHAPLFFTVQIICDEEIADRSFYWCNFTYRKGGLFRLPKTTLKIVWDKNSAAVTNTGSVPAAAVQIRSAEHAAHFTVSDSYFWLEPGETRTVYMNEADGIQIFAWNT